jgi:hypothetical protein
VAGFVGDRSTVYEAIRALEEGCIARFAGFDLALALFVAAFDHRPLS